MYIILVLALVGVLFLLHLLIDSLWGVLEFISSYLMPYFLPAEVQSLSKRFGPWAVVTGGTDGIGKQYAMELARRGIHIVIISRNPEKLRNVASEIEKEYNVKTKTIVADFSNGATIYPRIEAELKEIPVGILVNNVGLQYDYPMPLCELPYSKSWDIINVNVGAVTAMTKLILPSMVRRGAGAIVNVSSGSELQPLPLMTVYAATKAYIHSFTHAVREEYSSKGIFIQHVAPLFVSTKMNSFSQKLLDGNLLVPDAATYAKYAVSTLGRVQDTTGYWLHGFQYAFVKLAPVWIRTKIGMQLNKGFRQEYLHNAKIKTN